MARAGGSAGSVLQRHFVIKIWHRAELEEGGADVAETGEQAVELRLVRHRSGECAGAVVVPADGEPAEPWGPVVVEVAVDPDLVGGHDGTPTRRARPATRGRRITHSATARAAGTGRPAVPAGRFSEVRAFIGMPARGPGRWSRSWRARRG